MIRLLSWLCKATGAGEHTSSDQPCSIAEGRCAYLRVSGDDAHRIDADRSLDLLGEVASIIGETSPDDDEFGVEDIDEVRHLLTELSAEFAQYLQAEHILLGAGADEVGHLQSPP